MRRPLFVWLFAAVVWGCPKSAPPPREPLKPVVVALDQFQSLRWLQGTWRGSAPGGTPFYESFVFINDSTIRNFSYTDSTFAQASDSSLIALAGGQVINTGTGAVWLATRLDSTVVRFDPETGARNSFTWTESSRDRWTARLEWPDGDAAHPPLTYLMERVGH